MTGFKLEIKGKGLRKGVRKSTLNALVGPKPILGLKKEQKTVKQRPFSGGIGDESDDDKEDDDGKGLKLEITSFGSRGAIAKTPLGGNKLSGTKGPLVIKMAKPERRFGTDEDDQARQALLGKKNGPDGNNGLTIEVINKQSGVRVRNSSSLSNDGYNMGELVYANDDSSEESATESYDSVPVEMFGAALLRGMGWKPLAGLANTLEVLNAAKEVQHRQRGVVLGIGAQAVEEDLMKELMGRGKVEVPLKRKKVEK